jgi:cytochrome c biogenesis protein CcmG, thiol:disulfide interchange protein DsbE
VAARLIVVGSLLSGFLTVAVVLAGIFAYGPIAQRDAATPSPSAGPQVSPATSSSPSPAPTASASASPAGSGGSPSATRVSAFRVGQAAPALVLNKVGGGTTDLTSLRGHPVWITFMATFYPASRKDFPLMQRFADKYGPQGLTVLAVDVREDEPLVHAFVTSVGTSFPVLLDADGTAEERWAAFALPIHFWVDRDGIIRDGALGELGADAMAAGLQTIMPDVTVSP